MTTASTSNPPVRNSPAPAKPVTFRAHMRRKVAVVSRWLHIYLSMASFAIVLFFSVTGLTLNHTEWFANAEKTSRMQGEMQKRWLAGGDNPDKLAIVEYLRTTHKIHGAVADFRVDEAQIEVTFKAPGYMADAFIDRSTSHYDLVETRNGAAAVLNDLHKGRDAGKVWSGLIDASAILLVLVSFTGLVLLFFVYKRRTSGLILAACGAILCYLVYVRFVP